MLRTALRITLSIFAVLCSTFSGTALGLVVDVLVRFSRFNYSALFYVGIGIIFSLAAVLLRSFVPLEFHWQRVQARAGLWVESIFLVSFFLVGLVMAIGLFTFDWPTWCAALAAIALLVGAAILVNRLAGDAEPQWDGRCPICGYDLRGTTDPRCPECGTEFESIEHDNTDGC